MPAFDLGKDCQIFYKVGGQSAGGSWLELTNVRDVTLNLTSSEADVTTRANAGWKATVRTLKDGSVDFESVWAPGDAGFQALRDNYLSDNGIIGLQIFDSTGEGLQGDFMVTQLSRGEALEDAVKANVSAKLTYSTDPPSWVTP